MTAEPGGLPSMGSHKSDTTEVTSQQQQQQGVKTETFPLIEPVVASGVVARGV